MGKNKNNISPVKRGMNRNTAPYLLEGMEYLFALNTNIQDDDTSVINITNEESNVLAAKFEEGFKVIGKKNDILSKGTYFLLANPETGASELGIIRNNQVEQIDILDDLEVPLEEVEQEPYQTYESIIKKGLNFVVEHPIKKIVLKNEQCGKVMALTDGFNPPYLIELDNLEKYLIGDKEVDTEKIKIFKKSFVPKIDVKPVVTGGRLKKGTYQFLVAYTNKLGEEISEYTSITQPIPIFDSNNVIMEDSQIADRTNFAIKLELTNLDPSKEYYKVVVIQNADIEGGVSYFEEGIHPISDNSVIYATEENKVRTSLEEINKVFPYVKTWEGLTESQGHLIGYGIEEEKEINLQPVINLMGSFLKWQTSVARESLYQSSDDVSLSKGYMRNETYPFSVRVLFDNGYKTANFPLISRPAEDFKFDENITYYEKGNAPDTDDKKSIEANNPAYSNSDRKEFWQFYNTASKEGQRKSDIPYNTIQEPITKTSLIPNVAILERPSERIRMKLGNEEFTTLEDFIEDNYFRWQSPAHPLNFIFEKFNKALYKDEHDMPSFDNCEEPKLLDEDIIDIGEITLNEEEESIKFIERPIEEYIRVALDTHADIHEVNRNGRGSRRDEVAEDVVGETESARALWFGAHEWFFEKIQAPTNTSRKYAIPLNEVRVDYSATHNTTNIGYYIDGMARFNYEELMTEYTSIPSTEKWTVGSDKKMQVMFTDRVPINALWFRDEFREDEEVKVLEISKYIPQTKFYEVFSNAVKLRVTIYNDCTDEYDVDENGNFKCDETGFVTSFFIDPTKGDIRELVKANLQKERSYLMRTLFPSATELQGNKFLIAIDAPVGTRDEEVSVRIDIVHGAVITRGGNSEADIAWIAPTFNGKFAIHSRPVEYGAIDVIYDKITFDKRETYRANCNFEIPQVEEYEVAPYKFGKFSYIESSEKYPDNKELYDSSKLKVDLKKIPDNIKKDFKKYFVKDNPDGSYELNEEADFTNKPIRHFKFPDNNVAPFISPTRQAAFSDSIIYPLGVHLDDEVFSAFLDIAVDNGLMSQEKRDSVIGYEVFRGDRSLDKSIEAKGLLYDNYKNKEENEEVYFPNFPFNSLGDNALLYGEEDSKINIPHPYKSESNNSFSFISPDNQYRKLSTPTELQIEGYQFGNSKSYFSDVEEHPEWVILGRKAYDLANKLAVAETIAEIVIQIAEATIETSKNFWIQGGVTWGGNPVGSVVGSVATGVIAGFQILSNSVFKVARYRHQWLTTFRDMGQPENFASYYTGVGHYNSLASLSFMGNTLRGINTIKEVGSGRYSFRHNDTGDRIVLNNKDREKSTYIYLGEDFHIKYPFEYSSFDNYNDNSNYSSRPIASEEDVCSKGQSREIISNVASPYISLKNYVPSQYGAIDAIKWLPTSYVSYFDGNQDTIFGGDIFISRMTMKRKMPLFIRDAMKVGSLIPFNYRFYSNVGSARFFCNYEITDEVNLESSMFPDFKSEYNFDCDTGKNEFYVKPPSKFYLYYYGIVDFLVESEINNNFRYGKKEYKDNFYPNAADIIDWTQEKNVSIREPNTFHYNFAYSRGVTPINTRNLPFTYSKEEWDCRAINPNSAMWSNPDTDEKSLTEPWLVYKPLNKHQFPASYGKLTDIKGIENHRILARFENKTTMYGVVDMNVDGISSEMGDGRLFRRERGYVEADLGYMGSKTTDIISTEYGHFFPDVERGQIFKVDPSGEGMEEISKYSGGKPNGMDKWFKKHLPFKVFNPLVNNYDDIDTDNAYNGIGIAMGWDAKNKRVFITKKDYIPLKEMNYENGHFFAAKDEFDLITDYEADGYTYLGKEGYYYKFNKRSVTIPDTAKIFVVININDYTIDEANEIKGEIKDWNLEHGNELIFISTDSSRWLDITSQLVRNSVDMLYNQGVWNGFSTYNGQSINKEAIILNYTSNSAYVGDEPTSQFITDYKGFMTDFHSVDYLKTILISKDDVNALHFADILHGEGVYKDKAIQGTSPQQFLEPLGIYGVSHIQDFDMDTQKVLNEELGDEFNAGTILVKGDIIDVTDTEFFKDVSWTIAYQVEVGSWLSYYSFTPNYYVGHNSYFQSGVNNLEGKEGLWSHNMSNRSYGVFYGEKEDWIIEYPIKNEYQAKRLQNVSFWTEAKKFVNTYDYAYDRNLTFDNAVVYNNYGNSGKLNLIPQKTLSQVTKYPITRGDSQDILITNQDFNWTFNNIYDRTLNQNGISTAWKNDVNEIDKTINNDLVQFGGKKILSYLRGDYFIVRLTYNKSSEHNLLLKWATNQEEIY